MVAHVAATAAPGAATTARIGAAVTVEEEMKVALTALGRAGVATAAPIERHVGATAALAAEAPVPAVGVPVWL